MAQRDSFSHYGQDANSTSDSFSLANTGVPTPEINNAEDKPSMPITNVTKIMRQVLPPKTKISNDTKEMVQECCSKYISYISKKANERCKREYRKIMKAGDLFWAIENQGFAYYIAPLKLYLRRYHLEGIRNRGELVPPNGLIQDTNNNWFEPGSGSGSGFGPESIGPDFSIDPSPMDMFDLDEFRDGFGHSDDFNFDDLFNGEDDGKTN